MLIDKKSQKALIDKKSQKALIDKKSQKTRTVIDKKSQKMQVKQGQALWDLALDPGKPQINGGQEKKTR